MGRRKIPRFAPRSPLELDADAMRDMMALVVDRVVDHVASLPDQPAHAVRGGRKLARALTEPMPERGAPLERLLKSLFGRVIPNSLNTAGPGYMAYIPGGGLFQAAVADFIALATNRYVGVWVAAPALVRLEQNVLAWLSQMVGLPEAAGGVLTSGGSIAGLCAVVAARHEKLGDAIERGTFYLSTEAHHSLAKAASIAGILPERVRRVAVDDRLRIDVADLERRIEEDRRAGLRPFLIAASAGTTNTGSVDDLPQVARVARAHGLWLHVDAAYGGFFCLTERGRARLSGIELADSVTLDPHKGLFLPYGTGCVLVRERATLKRAFASHAAYMPPMQEDEDLVDFCDLGPELSREARGLRVWLPLKLHGAAAFREALDEKLDLAAHAARRLEEMEGVEVVCSPELSVIAFRVSGGERDDEGEAINRAVLARVHERQRAVLTTTRVRGRLVLRIAILSFRTHRAHVDRLLDDIEDAVRRVTPSAAG